ncbi:hypothetical protein HO133_004286 [Letharia lupina]|uniref:Ribosome recycling factor domain-containing protein n=1 Tax=Letharia lupina TaxID=560253 RepID=A0A8H6KZI8_9LECA|nr:uncharacterized protein HO133_004286 [Letharia lupina]KAF6229948.1 hypothetical protein HO133_004286 [Letharia lupina]
MRAKLPTTLISTLSRPRFPHPPSRITLQPCCPNNPAPTHPTLPPPTRTLTTTTPLLKKGGKQDSKRTVSLNASKAQSQAHSPTVNAFDFSDYEAAIEHAHEHLKSELAKIKAGGRNAEDIEGLRVVLGKGGGEGRGNGDNEGGGGKGRAERESVKLGDVASVVARGRNVGVLVGEKDHLKPVLSALASLPSLTYTTSPTDPLTLTIAIPPVTAESRLAAKKQADKKGEEALFALREARGAQRKKHRSMELGKLVGPDELRRAEREVEKVNEGAVGEARRLVEGCRRGLEGG